MLQGLSFQVLAEGEALFLVSTCLDGNTAPALGWVIFKVNQHGIYKTSRTSMVHSSEICQLCGYARKIFQICFLPLKNLKFSEKYKCNKMWDYLNVLQNNK